MMVVLTHKVGMILNLSGPLGPGQRELIEEGIEGKAGVIRVEFNLPQGNMVIIEYDPHVTSPTELHQKLREINLTTESKPVFVSRPPPETDDNRS